MIVESFISIISVWWKTILEVGLLWFVIYHILLFFEGTRALQVLRGIIMILVAFFLSQKLGLEVLEWLLTKLFAISVIAILIIFHPEIRQGLARLGQHNLFAMTLKEEELDLVIKEIVEASEELCKNKVGALIAIENVMPLDSYVDSGILVDARVSSELIQTIFTPNSLLHDGSVIIQKGLISAAGCLLPLTQNQEISRIFGTRHRAAIGLSEDTDAVIIVISEERHDMSVVYRSRLYKDLSKDDMILKVKEFIKLSRKTQ